MDNVDYSFSPFLNFFLFISAVLLLPFNCLGQPSDQFEDGDFTKSPVWQGDESDFAVNEDQQLQLMAQEAGESYLSTSSQAIDQAVWTIYLALDFNPSSHNYTRIYLTSDRPNLSDPLNGYFVMVGGSEDEISLYKQTGKEAFKIIDGKDKRLDLNLIKAKIKVARTQKGEWTLWTAVNDTTIFYKEGSAQDLEFAGGAYTGILCTYTVTRKDKFYFDDFKVTGSAFEDTIPPDLLKVHFKDTKTLKLIFTEPLSAIPAEAIQNYKLKPNIGMPESATLEKEAQNIVHLSFEKPLKVGNSYLLNIEGISDTVGNEAGSLVKSFLFFLAREGNYREVVINELMVDPTPRVGLPKAEFIELFNNSESAFNLLGWQISDDRSGAVLDQYRLFPREYLILCSVSDTALFKTYGDVMGISPWLSLNNEGDAVRLANEEGQMMDQVHYNDEWYKSSIRGSGGYTLEMIDPLNPCSEAANWKASESRYGGSPGQINAVYARKPDLKGPELERVFPKDAHTLLLYFNEGLDTATLDQAEYRINETLIKAQARPNDLQTITLTLPEALEPGMTYTFEVHKVKDCNGNYMGTESNKFMFGLPQDADSAEVIINEVLFNPKANGVDFIEIYNNSKKYLNLKDWMLANTGMEEETGVEIVDNRKPFTEGDFLFAPGSLLVLTSNIDQTLENYPKGASKKMLEMETLPGYPDDAGTIILLNQENKQIDHFDYSEDYHSPILDDTEGVSLERIAYDAPTQDPQNWASAASISGFATPGKYNSQSRTIGEPLGAIHIEPKVITPDNNGSNDFTTIQYFFRNQSYVANIYVYDAEGRRISKIVENETLGTSGFFIWRGVDDHLKRVKMGIYLIYIEIFNLNGIVKVFKKPIVIGGKL